MLAHIPYLRRQTRRSWFQEELALPCILRYVKIFYFRASANILVSLFWSLWLFLHFTHWFQRDDKGFAHPERIEKLVKNYSQFVSFPIYTWQEKGFTKEVWLCTPDLLILLTLSVFLIVSFHNPFLKTEREFGLSFYLNLSITDRGWWGSSWGENGQPRREDWGYVLHMPCIPWINCLWNYDYRFDCITAVYVLAVL